MTIDNAQLVHTYADFKDCAKEFSGSKGANGMSAQDAMLVIMRGREIGLPPATAMLSVHIINGKPSLSARAKVASVQANPLCEYFEEVSASDTEATYETMRRGAKRVQTETFTIAEAERAGLLKNKTWLAYPKAMPARASSALADRVYSDILLGLATEEIEYDLAAQPAPTGYVQQPAAPTAPALPVLALVAPPPSTAAPTSRASPPPPRRPRSKPSRSSSRTPAPTTRRTKCSCLRTRTRSCACSR